MKRKKIERVDLSREQIEGALAYAQGVLPPQVFHVLQTIVLAYLNLVSLVEAGCTTIKRLQRMLFGPTSEKTEELLARVKKQLKQASVAATREGKRGKRRGHGRNGQAAYRGAAIVSVPHQKFKPGDRCPGCRKAKLFDPGEPGVLVRVVGQAPLQATIYHTQKLRCPLCGEIFEAKPPPGVGKEKYDATSASMIGIFKDGRGFPFHRLQKVQKTMGIPLAASTPWEIVRDAEKKLRPVHEELVRQAAQGEVLHQDDTDMKILARMGKRREREEKIKGSAKKERTGMFTSGIVSQGGRWRIALLFTGMKHAGENLKALLEHRRSGLARPIQRCDALLRHMPKELKTILANGLAHSRRKFVDVVHNFPDACLHVLNVLKRVDGNDAIAKRRGMTARER